MPKTISETRLKKELKSCIKGMKFLGKQMDKTLISLKNCNKMLKKKN